MLGLRKPLSRRFLFWAGGKFVQLWTWAKPVQTVELFGIDEAERERIRSALKRYKELHGIGDPLLLKHIMGAINLPLDLSTLQRFLRGKHRTDEIPVHRYRRFLQLAAPPPAGDELAKALKGFLPLSLSVTPKGAVSALAGKYRSFARPYQHSTREAAKPVSAWPRKIARSRSGVTGFTPTCSAFTMKPAREGFLRVTERIDDKQQEEPTRKGEIIESTFGGSGILVPCGAREFFMAVHSYLDTRFYLLKRISDEPLVLHGFAYRPESMFEFAPSAPADPWRPSFEIVMSRGEPSEPSAK